MATRTKASRRTSLAKAARESRDRILESGLPLGNVTQPEGRGGETKSRILATAIAQFAERGFEACTMRDIAAAVGIKAPAIYNHYSSKDDVLAAAMEHILGRFFWFLLEPLDDKAVEDWLECLIRNHVGFQLEHRDLSKANDALLNAPGKERVLPPKVYRRIVGVERDYVELISVLVRLNDPAMDPWDGMMSGFAITAMCDRVVAWYDPQGKLKAPEVAERSWRLASRMIGAPS